MRLMSLMRERMSCSTAVSSVTTILPVGPTPWTSAPGKASIARRMASTLRRLALHDEAGDVVLVTRHGWPRLGASTVTASTGQTATQAPQPVQSRRVDLWSGHGFPPRRRSGSRSRRRRRRSSGTGRPGGPGSRSQPGPCTTKVRASSGSKISSGQAFCAGLRKRCRRPPRSPPRAGRPRPQSGSFPGRPPYSRRRRCSSGGDSQASPRVACSGSRGSLKRPRRNARRRLQDLAVRHFPRPSVPGLSAGWTGNELVHPNREAVGANDRHGEGRRQNDREEQEHQAGPASFAGCSWQGCGSRFR